MEPKIRLITGVDGITKYEVIKYSQWARRYTVMGRFNTRKEAQKFIDKQKEKMER